MNNEKISLFITKLRKEKNLTQQELAERLFITDKAISKWERGISLPDITMFEKIATILDVSVAELIKGERINNNDNDQINKIIISSLNQENKKNKMKNKIIIILSFIIFIIIFSLLFIFFYKNYNNVLSYDFAGVSDNFGFYNGQVMYSSIKKKYNIDGFELLDKSTINLENLITVKVSISFNNKDWGYHMYEPSDVGILKVSDWLKNIHFGETGKSAKCKKNQGCESDSFLDSDKNEFPNNMQIKIEYCDKNNECNKENFKIYTEKIASNKFFN